MTDNIGEMPGFAMFRDLMKVMSPDLWQEAVDRYDGDEYRAAYALAVAVNKVNKDLTEEKKPL